MALVGTVVAILAGCAGSPSRLTQAIAPPVCLAAAGPIGRGCRCYPDNEVFHGANRGHFVYQEGEKWLALTEPPRISREVLFASPSMAAGFQSGPVADHSSVVRLYPQPRILVMSGIRLP